MATVPSTFAKLNDADWLRHQYLDVGRTKRDIAKEVGCAPSTVGDALAAFGIRKRTHEQPVGSVPAEWLNDVYVRQRRSIASIASELGVAPPTVRRALDEAGIELRREGRPAELDDPAWCEEHQHESPRELAKHLGCAPETVRRAMQRHGFKSIRGAEELPYPQLADADWLRVRHHDDGLTHGRIADLVGCSRTAVTQAMQRLGVPSGPPGPERHPLLADAAWLQHQVDGGRSLEQIGEVVGRDPTTVRDALDAHRIAY